MHDLTFWEVQGPITSDQAAFLNQLRALTCPPYLSCVRESEESFLVTVDVDATDVALLSGAVRFEPGRIHADRLDTHDDEFPAAPTTWARTYTGTGRELAEHAARWLRAFSERPIVREEWLHRDIAYAHCYVVTDTGDRLAEGFVDEWAPPGLKRRLELAGAVRNGWVQTDGLGPPDRVVPVRGGSLTI